MDVPGGFTIDDRVPQPRRTPRQILGEALLVAPNLAKLLYRLLRDPRVPARRKVLVGAAGLYLASPIDLIPEMLVPVLGQLDDLLLVVLSIHYLVASVDDAVAAEYWDGSEDALELVSAMIEWMSDLVPGPVRKMLAR